ncbi:predicted protein [Chaetomium globosum CBS 148.51]|uniref:Uncharacterized protein n=1 Tax=Chaetomium globosum (strain ATCC 6205 / CBS 148.51 / DSM 1962 / NBRC 6347 / NRRL 1970) TaxID=306901 RepID=Q2GWZ7_CHAGB|nr:uncharacterized protein CHGG_07507 [Chaetomium globosum CBS 148.51]EAQ86254.1 predicted protein [Chaetomium globosum CBS 148.51]
MNQLLKTKSHLGRFGVRAYTSRRPRPCILNFSTTNKLSNPIDRATAARDFVALLTPIANAEQEPVLPKPSGGDASSVPDRRKVLSAIESLLHTLNPEQPLYAAFHDGLVHDPLGGGSYAFRDDLIKPLLEGLMHDEALNLDAYAEARLADNIPSRPIVIHAGAQPNNSPHCGTLIVFCYAFAVARAMRDRMQAMAAHSRAVFQPPPVSVNITFVDTAPVKGEGLEIDGIHYQKSYRDTPSASATWTGDYHEVLNLLSRWSNIPVTTTVQSDFFSNPFVPQLLDYFITNHRTLGRQLSPKYGTLALRAACPIPGCNLAEKHGRLNRYTKSTTTPDTPAAIIFHCPHHGPHTIPITRNPPALSRLEANAPTRNLLRSMSHLLDTHTHHVRVTGADYAGGVPGGDALPAAGGVERSDGGERGRVLGTAGLGSYRVLKRGVVGGDRVAGDEEGLRRIWEEVGRWVADPRKLFRCYSVEYLRRVIVEGRAWE